MKKIIILGLVAVILGGLGLWSNFGTQSVQTYTNTQYGFSLIYPPGWKEKSLVFSSPSDQLTNAKREEECQNGCEGAYYTRGISFSTSVHKSWLPVIEERGTQKIGSIDWDVKVYDGSGLGIVTYESKLGSHDYVFWEMLSYSDKAKFEQLLANFKPL